MVNVDMLMGRSDVMLRSTAPIYRLDDRDRLDLFGTGVFVRHESQHFLVSAAHVLVEMRERGLRVGGESHIIPLAGRFFHTGATGEVTFDNEAFDVAFVPLSEDQVAGLGHPPFISTTEIDRSLESGAPYAAVGFIAKDYRTVGPRQSVEVKATALLAVAAPPENYSERGVTNDSHLLLSFDRLKTYSGEGPAATPKIIGMSGCGVWSAGEARELLAAILTEHHQQRGKFIVSTRITSLIPSLSAYVAGDLR